MDVRVDGAMSLREAAQLLDVTEKQIQYLARNAQIIALARGLLDARSVRAYQAHRQGVHTRGWSYRTAWAAIALLSKYDQGWIGQPQGSRLRSRLGDMNAEQLVAAARNRALIGHFSGHPAVVARLHADSRTVAQRSLPGLTLLGTVTDWYIERRDERCLVNEYGLQANPAGDLVIRAVDTNPYLSFPAIDLTDVADLIDRGVLTALDAATSPDPRESGVAKRLLSDALGGFRSDA